MFKNGKMRRAEGGMGEPQKYFIKHFLITPITFIQFQFKKIYLYSDHQTHEVLMRVEKVPDFNKKIVLLRTFNKHLCHK